MLVLCDDDGDNDSCFLIVFCGLGQAFFINLEVGLFIIYFFIKEIEIQRGNMICLD